MPQRTEDSFIFEHSPDQPVAELAVRRLIVNGAIGPAVRVRRTGQEQYQPLGTLHEYRVLFHQVQPEQRLVCMPTHTPWFVWGLLGLMFKVFLLSWRGSTHWQFQGFLMNDYASILELGQWYRLWSAAFFHQSLSHFLLNACIIGYLGFHIELRMGSRVLAVLSLLSIGTGGLFSLLGHPMSSSVGASAAAYAYLVFAICLGLRDRTSAAATSEHLGWPLVPYLILALGLGIADPQLDHAGHFGGALVGLVFAFSLVKKRDGFRIRWLIPSLVVSMLGFFIFWLFWQRHLLIPLVANTDPYGFTVRVPKYWKSGWGNTGERAWLSPTVKAQVSAESIIHPASSITALQRLEERLSHLGQEPSVYNRDFLRTGGSDGWLWSGTVLQADGLRSVWLYVVCRGQLEHYLTMSVPEAEHERYKEYWDIILSEIQLQSPERLWLAKSRVDERNSIEHVVSYAGELKIVGHVPAALEEYERALIMDPSSIEAMVGRLRCLYLLDDPSLFMAIKDAEQWMLRSEVLAEELMFVGADSQRVNWLPLLKKRYAQSLWLRYWVDGEE